MADPTVIWQCAQYPKHRGWRTDSEPRGTCDYCLCVTRWEQEITGGRREYAPANALRFVQPRQDGP